MTTGEIYPRPDQDFISPELLFWEGPDIAPIVLRVLQAHDSLTLAKKGILHGARQAIELAGISNLHTANFKKIDADEDFRL